MLKRLIVCATALIVPGVQGAAAEEPALVTFKVLNPAVALDLAQAAMESCRKSGYQVAVSVVDRFGTPQVLLRDRFAGPHTPDTARRKAWTAVSFRTNTSELDDLAQPGHDSFGLRWISDALPVGGGIMIQSAGTLIGAVGVSGAPGPAIDDECAKAGIAAIEDALGF